jgi:hypothetical protein
VDWPGEFGEGGEPEEVGGPTRSAGLLIVRPHPVNKTVTIEIKPTAKATCAGIILTLWFQIKERPSSLPRLCYRQKIDEITIGADRERCRQGGRGSKN